MRIKATTLQRLIMIIEPSTPEEFRMFKVENNCLIACNKYVACVERVDNDNNSFYINITENFINAVKREADVDGDFLFNVIEDIALGTVTSTLTNIQCDEVITWPDNSPLDKWREWFVEPEVPNSFMYCDLPIIKSLWEVSPTGEIVFPKYIDADGPVIVRDVNTSDWVGVFIPAVKNKKVLKPATLPEWMNDN